MKWNNRNYRPSQPEKFIKQEVDIEDLMRPLGEKIKKGNYWLAVPNPIAVNVPPSSTPPQTQYYAQPYLSKNNSDGSFPPPYSSVTATYNGYSIYNTECPVSPNGGIFCSFGPITQGTTGTTYSFSATLLDDNYIFKGSTGGGAPQIQWDRIDITLIELQDITNDQYTWTIENNYYYEGNLVQTNQDIMVFVGDAEYSNCPDYCEPVYLFYSQSLYFVLNFCSPSIIISGITCYPDIQGTFNRVYDYSGGTFEFGYLEYGGASDYYLVPGTLSGNSYPVYTGMTDGVGIATFGYNNSLGGWNIFDGNITTGNTGGDYCYPFSSTTVNINDGNCASFLTPGIKTDQTGFDTYTISYPPFS